MTRTHGPVHVACGGEQGLVGWQAVSVRAEESGAQGRQGHEEDVCVDGGDQGLVGWQAMSVRAEECRAQAGKATRRTCVWTEGIKAVWQTVSARAEECGAQSRQGHAEDVCGQNRVPFFTFLPKPSFRKMCWAVWV